jgi:hypothetical protein
MLRYEATGGHRVPPGPDRAAVPGVSTAGCDEPSVRAAGSLAQALAHEEPDHES